MKLQYPAASTRRFVALVLLLLALTGTPSAAADDSPESKTDSPEEKTVLVLGATGATGRHVVKQLLAQNQRVSVLVRSKERMLAALGYNGTDVSPPELLTITEGSILDVTNYELSEQIKPAAAVVSCLGHTLDLAGLWGKHDRHLVTDTVRRFMSIMTVLPSNQPKKLILMGSDGVAHPDGTTDTPRSVVERAIIFLIRHLIAPHKDNEEAALFLYNYYMEQKATELQQHENNKKKMNPPVEWVVVRPTDLIEATPEEADNAATALKYTVYDKPPGSLFGSGTTKRATVAKFMVDLLQSDNLWQQYKYQMPVLHDATPAPPASAEEL